MSNLALNVSVTGLESIDKDAEAILGKITSAVNNTSYFVGQLMMDQLQEHINIDVYRAYQPKEYPRRSVNSQFGIPLNDLDRNARPINIKNPNGIGARVGLEYKPDGSHSGTTADLPVKSDYYDADNPRPLKPNPVHGDALIRRIETGRGYDWNCYPGKREFWHKFVKGILDDGEAEYEIKRVMEGFGFPLEGDAKVYPEGGRNDGEY